MADRPKPGTRTSGPSGEWRSDGWWANESYGWNGPYASPEAYRRRQVDGMRRLLRALGRAALACLAVLALMVACGLYVRAMGTR